MHDQRFARPGGHAETDGVRGDADALGHRDGHRVRFVEEGVDTEGEYLLIEHVWPRPGMMAGPHWHPVLAETFAVEEGKVRFRVDGREFVVGPGEAVTVWPGEVHGFWNEGEEPLVMMHRVSPPGRHREMFELWNRLDVAGKTNRQGVPTNPLALGLLWERQDGYVAGLPASVQSLVFGGLARLARLVGYEARWSTGNGASRPVGSEQPGSGLRLRPTGALRFFLRLPVYLYRLRLGRLLGHRFVLLTHRGRRSGRVYRTVLEVIRYEPSTREIVTVSGRGERSDWYRNLRAQPALEIRSGRECYAPEQRFLTPDQVYAEIVDYERRHPWAVRVVPPLLGYSGWTARSRHAGPSPNPCVWWPSVRDVRRATNTRRPSLDHSGRRDGHLDVLRGPRVSVTVLSTNARILSGFRSWSSPSHRTPPPRRAISSGGTSRTCWDSPQRWPKGSMIWPWRSPQKSSRRG